MAVGILWMCAMPSWVGIGLYRYNQTHTLNMSPCCCPAMVAIGEAAELGMRSAAALTGPAAGGATRATGATTAGCGAGAAADEPTGVGTAADRWVGDETKDV